MIETEVMYGDPGGYCFFHFYPFTCDALIGFRRVTPMNYFLDKFPPTVEKAVDKLAEDMTFADRTRLANMNEAALIRFHHCLRHFPAKRIPPSGQRSVDEIMHVHRNRENDHSRTGILCDFEATPKTTAGRTYLEGRQVRIRFLPANKRRYVR